MCCMYLTWNLLLTCGRVYFDIKGKVKCTLVQALRLCTGRTAHRGSRGIALPFLDHSTRRGWGVSVTPRLLFTPRKDPVPIVQEAGWAPGAENLAPTWIRSLDRPACSQSLYRLSYPAHVFWHTLLNIGSEPTGGTLVGHEIGCESPPSHSGPYSTGGTAVADVRTLHLISPGCNNYCRIYSHYTYHFTAGPCR